MTLNEEYPRLQVMRGPKRKGVRYFGPYAHAWAIRETLDTAAARLPGAHLLATASSSGPARSAGPCLLGYIGKCSAPCVGRVSAEEHRADRRRLLRLHGRPHRRRSSGGSSSEMHAAARELEFERAARLRDDLGRAASARWRSRRSSSATAPTPTSSPSPRTSSRPPSRSSTCAAAGSAASAAGSSTRSRTVDAPASWSSSSCSRSTAASTRRPRSATAGEACRARCWCPSCRRTPTHTPSWLERAPRRPGVACGCRSAATSGRCWRPSSATPARRSRCTAQARASDLTARSLALAEIQEALGLPDAPLRIECYDVSHLQGTNVVASMVVFEDGLARKSEYRRFAVKGTDGTTTSPRCTR